MSKDKSDRNWFGRHKILTGLGIIILLIIIVSAAGGGDKSNTANVADSSNASSSSKPEKKAATTAKIGQPVRDGKFEFTVDNVKCGETSVGDQYLNKQAQGQYCRLHMTIKNIGNEAQSLSSSDQYLFNAAGQKYAADDEANIYDSSTGSSSTWYNEINPGNSVTGDILFDVPKDQTPVKVELHDSAFSDGVEVTLK